MKNTAFAGENGKQEFIKINPFDIMVTGNKGEVELTEEGFVLRGDGILKISDLTFSKSLGTDVGRVFFSGDLIKLTNINLEVKNYLKIKETPYETVFHTPNMNKVINKGFLQSFLENVDVRITGIPDVPIETDSDNDLGKNLEIYDINKIYDLVGGAKNFVSIIGENVIVGGKGEIELLRDLNSLTGVEIGLDGEKTEDKFNVKIGDIKLRFDKNKLYYTKKPSKNAFSIDNIQAIYQGKVYGASSIKNDPDTGEKYFDKKGKLVTGRIVGIGLLGSSFDAHIDVDEDDFYRIQRSVQDRGFANFFNYDKEILADELFDSTFELRTDIYIPAKGVSISGDELRQVIGSAESDRKHTLFSFLDENLFSKSFKIEELGERKLSQSTIDGIKGLVSKSVESVDSLKGGRFSFAIRNNPNKDPSLVLYFPDGKSEEIKLQGDEASFVRDLLQLTVRLPLMPRAPSNVQSLKSAWERNIGKSVSRFSLGDALNLRSSIKSRLTDKAETESDRHDRLELKR